MILFATNLKTRDRLQIFFNEAFHSYKALFGSLQAAGLNQMKFIFQG